MRLPPRQSTAEADLMVPFQLVSACSIAKILLLNLSYFMALFTSCPVPLGTWDTPDSH